MLRELTDQTLGAAGANLDRAFVRLAFQSRSAVAQGTQEAHVDGLDAAAALYPRLDREGRLFAAPPAAVLSERAARPLPGGAVVDVDWPSGWLPLHPAYAALQARHPQNAIARARWFRHDRPAAALVCLHGWGAGRFAFEELCFDAGRFYRLGLDVVLATMPFHAQRGPRWSLRPVFPGAEPVRANEGFAQAARDLRGLFGALRARGAPGVALTGISMGGFTTALLATVEPELEAVVPMLPFGSLPALIWEHGQVTAAMASAAASGVDQARFAAAFAAITPLARTLRVARERVLLIAGRHDRVTHPDHARRLAEHFGAPLEFFGGSHLLQLDRGAALSALARFLRARGLVP